MVMKSNKKIVITVPPLPDLASAQPEICLEEAGENVFIIKPFNGLKKRRND